MATKTKTKTKTPEDFPIGARVRILTDKFDWLNNKPRAGTVVPKPAPDYEPHYEPQYDKEFVFVDEDAPRRYRAFPYKPDEIELVDA